MTKRQGTVPRKVVTRRQLSRFQREKKRQRTTIVVGISVIVIILGIVAYGYYDTIVAPTRAPVVRVNDTVYSMGYYVKMLRLLTYSSGQESPSMGTIPFQLIQTIEDNELIRQGTPRMNIGVTEEEIDKEVRDRIRPSSEEDKQLSAKEIEAEFKRLYKQYLNETKLTEKEHRRLAEVDLLREKLRERLGQRVPTVAEQVHVLAILVEDENQANDALEKLKSGEDFAKLSAEISSDEELKEKKGDLGWLPRGVMSEDFDKVAFDLELEKLSELILDTKGIYIIKVTEKAKARTIDKEPREKLKDKALQSWLLEERNNNKIERYFDSDKYAWAVKQVTGK